MEKPSSKNKNVLPENTTQQEENEAFKAKTRNRGKKRKRQDSESSTTFEDILPDNALEVEKNLHASAIKNNLDDASVKKILKKVVTNDHVLALVKLREEEEQKSVQEKPSTAQHPKITRAKAKELMKVSPKSAPWNLELTPIKHIPVKTRPEVKALIALELPEDEDDEEYKPTNDDIPSDDDHVLESCSDLESQPPTPATPSGEHTTSPRVIKDGPFKVPQELTTPTRRKLVIVEKEEATIALRTRSKLCLSETPIEHIESSFVPPDDIPVPAGDDLWNKFLEECLNPAEVSRNEEDDETDPEYNVAADPDAHDEEEDLERSLIKISKKELNDLMTELFSIMPEAGDDLSNLANNLLPENNTQIPGHFVGKQEPLTDDEAECRAGRITFEKRDSITRISIGKTEIEDTGYSDVRASEQSQQHKDIAGCSVNTVQGTSQSAQKVQVPAVVNMTIEETTNKPQEELQPPPVVQNLQVQLSNSDTITVQIDKPGCVLPEQELIIKQQLRQHIQLATSNFLQLYVNPIHWSYAPPYKDYLEQFEKLLEENPKSIVDVCNLKPALELVRSWEKSVSEDTPENQKMVEFILNEAERNRRRNRQHALYVGDFPETYKRVIANSTVFLYPYLLPPMPYRPDIGKKFGYKRSEDQLIVLGLDQFWRYVDDNPKLFPRPNFSNPRHRWGLATTVRLVCKYMFPWVTPSMMMCHLHKAKRDKDGPIYDYIKFNKMESVQHKLLTFNPKLTLYEQPEHEMPRIWVRYLAKSSRRFRDFLYRRQNCGKPAEGVLVDSGAIEMEPKRPLPIDFTKVIESHRMNLLPKVPPPPPMVDKYDINIEKNATTVPADNGNNVLTKNQLIPSLVNIPVTNVLPANAKVICNFLSVIHTDLNESTGKNVARNVNLTNANNVIVTNANVCVTNANVNVTNANVNVTNATPPMAHENKNKETQVDKHKVMNNVGKELDVNKDKINTKVTQPTLLISPNMFRVVNTNVGSYLVPFVIQSTNTVNSINTPVVSTGITISNINPKNLQISEDKKTAGEAISEKNKDIEKSVQKDSDVVTVQDGKANELENHCMCCIMLRKICQVKQKCITDYFKSNRKKESNVCECSSKEYPRISKRLKLLIRNYKKVSWCVHRELQSKLNLVKKEKENRSIKDESEIETLEDDYSLEDLAFATSYQLKLTTASNAIRDTTAKRKIQRLFSNFDPDTHNVLKLTEEAYKIFGIDLVDLYQEFLGFLTAEQADSIDVFRDYFLNNCATDLIKKIESEINNKDDKQKLLSHINGLLADRVSTSCEMCRGLLSYMNGYPKLARYVFSLFPHRSGRRKKQNKCQNNTLASQSRTKETTSPKKTTPTIDAPRIETTEPKRPYLVVEPLQRLQPSSKDDTVTDINKPMVVGHLQASSQVDSNFDEDPTEDTLMICDDMSVTKDYEADDSSSGEEDVLNLPQTLKQTAPTNDQPENTVESVRTDNVMQEQPSHIVTTEITISKTEAEEYSDTEMSAMMMSDDELVKTETPDWKREEDKLILQILIQYISPDERGGKTVMETIEEKNVYQLIANSLTHKTVTDIKERVMYLLNILVTTEY